MKAFALLLLVTPFALSAADFEQDIRSLLKQRCVECHGPEKQRADLRLDAKPHAFKGGESGPAIIPSKAADSPMFQRVTASGDERMPPKGEPLTSAQIATLKAWIDSGADWPENAEDKAAATDPRLNHWAYQPLPPHDPAATIDSFIEAKLRENGLTMAPRADARTLIRRAHFVITGLPPDPSNQTDPSYPDLVDTLLNSPHYGEKWARHWLDVVRFADSHGFETNHERPHAWRYRDYVINAFNSDKPYDRFMFEQIAGDTCGADAATGFIVGGPWDRVKGQDKNLQLMQRADELSDIVNTTGTAFLAATMVCAKCHNHKFDPISQTDFYAMQSVFSGVQHGDRPIKTPEHLAQEKKAGQLRSQLAPLNAKLAEHQPLAALTRRILLGEVDAQFLKQPKGSKATDYDPGTEPGQLSDPGDATRFPNIGESYRYFVEEPGTDCVAWHPQVAGRYRIWVSWGVWTTHAPDARFILETEGRQTEIGTINQRQFADGKPAVPNQKRWSSLKSLGDHTLTEATRILLRTGPTRAPMAADILLLEELPAESHASRITHQSPHLRPPVTHTANTDRFPAVSARHLRFVIEASHRNNACIDELEIFGPGGENLAPKAKTTSSGDYGPSAIHKLAHINDGKYGNSRSWIVKEPAGWVQFDFDSPQEISRVVWSRDRSTGGKVYADRLASAYRIEVSPDGKNWAAVASSADRLDIRFNQKIKSIPSSSDVPPALLAKVEALQKQLTSIAEPPLAYAGTFTQPEPTRRYHRGDHLSPREVVAPDGLELFKATLGSFNLPPDAPEQERRVAFAKWLTDPRNPLPARVMVNRIWHYIFGTGLVATPSDFGHMGFKPTHPELLDWLANEFIRSGWSIKHIQRLILTSRTFQQSSALTDSRITRHASEKDASNTLLWRFLPRRLDAEIIRDSILAVTGSLDLTPGGPGFLLFEPNANYSRNWVAKTTSFERQDYRRMIYALKLRMEPDAIFAAFDAPDGGQVCPSRDRSTTPLQALNLFNSPFLIEQAEKLATKAKTIPEAYQLAYQRPPTQDELTAAKTFVKQEGLPALCRALLNSNEFLFLE
jgi:mono/diheme cytochrome c family protein